MSNSSSLGSICILAKTSAHPTVRRAFEAFPVTTEFYGTLLLPQRGLRGLWLKEGHNPGRGGPVGKMQWIYAVSLLLSSLVEFGAAIRPS